MRKKVLMQQNSELFERLNNANSTIARLERELKEREVEIESLYAQVTEFRREIVLRSNPEDVDLELDDEVIAAADEENAPVDTLAGETEELFNKEPEFNEDAFPNFKPIERAPSVDPNVTGFWPVPEPANDMVFRPVNEPMAPQVPQNAEPIVRNDNAPTFSPPPPPVFRPAPNPIVNPVAPPQNNPPVNFIKPPVPPVMPPPVAPAPIVAPPVAPPPVATNPFVPPVYNSEPMAQPPVNNNVTPVVPPEENHADKPMEPVFEEPVLFSSNDNIAPPEVQEEPDTVPNLKLVSDSVPVAEEDVIQPSIPVINPFVAVKEPETVKEPVQLPTLDECIEYGSQTIGKIVVSAARYSNLLTAGGETKYKELLNLILGRTEVAKSEILDITVCDAETSVKKHMIDDVYEQALEYFESVMAQI